MTKLEFRDDLPFALETVFGFFLKPANIIAVAPPWLRLQLIDAPTTIAEGSVLRVATRRYGIPQEITTRIAALVPRERIVEVQVQGPFRAWEHRRLFSPTEAGCLLIEQIDFEPPGGMLGLMLTREAVTTELQRVYAERRPRLLEALAGRDG